MGALGLGRGDEQERGDPRAAVLDDRPAARPDRRPGLHTLCVWFLPLRRLPQRGVEPRVRSLSQHPELLDRQQDLLLHSREPCLPPAGLYVLLVLLADRRRRDLAVPHHEDGDAPHGLPCALPDLAPAVVDRAGSRSKDLRVKFPLFSRVFPITPTWRRFSSPPLRRTSGRLRVRRLHLCDHLAAVRDVLRLGLLFLLLFRDTGDKRRLAALARPLLPLGRFQGRRYHPAGDGLLHRDVSLPGRRRKARAAAPRWPIAQTLPFAAWSSCSPPGSAMRPARATSRAAG